MSVVIIRAEAVPDYIRGYLERFLIEPEPGLFVGNLSARVRDSLWKRCCEEARTGRLTLIHSAPGRQGFTVTTHRSFRNAVHDSDGWTLIRQQEVQVENESA